MDNVKKAVELFLKHYQINNPISILVDSDPDGYCSASMMYMYIKESDEEYPVHYILHKNPKTHGLCGDYEIPKDTKLLIIPDAGTNDVEQCEKLNEKGMDVLILDHHESEKENPYALIVNNQMSLNYPNKQLCGAGVVYKFLQALDEETWYDLADNYLDLCALGNISDVMDMRSFETRYLVGKGLNNIKNKCFKELLNAQEYSINGKINIHNIQWHITTLLNGCIRVGTYEEKDLLFRAFIEQDELFEYKKRATKDHPSEVIEETIYERAARLCKNAKSKQDRTRDKGLKLISDEVENNLTEEDKVIITDVTDILEDGLTGVVAIRVAEKFNKPCILLRQHTDNSSGKVIFGGSARNFNNSPIVSFKDIINQTGIMTGLGHANACGVVNLRFDNLDLAKISLNKLLHDVEYTTTYYVDFLKKADEVDISSIMEFSKLDNYIGQGIDEPKIAVEDIELNRKDIEVFGKNEDTLSFNINDVKYIQFKCKEGNGLYDFVQDAWSDNNCIKITVVGKPSVNEYNGVKTPQIIIEDLNVLDVSNIEEDEDNFEW